MSSPIPPLPNLVDLVEGVGESDVHIRFRGCDLYVLRYFTQTCFLKNDAFGETVS